MSKKLEYAVYAACREAHAEHIHSGRPGYAADMSLGAQAIKTRDFDELLQLIVDLSQIKPPLQIEFLAAVREHSTRES